jgi:hypothetical protein
MAQEADYQITISPVQLMAFTVAVIGLIGAMVFFTANMVVNGQKAVAQQQNTIGAAAPQYVLADAATSCSDTSYEKGDDEHHAVGDRVSHGGHAYQVVAAHYPAATQINEDNDTTVNESHVTTVRTVIKNNGNTDVDNRNSGNTEVDNRHSGNTTTDNRDSGNTSVDNRNRDNDYSDNRDSGNVTTNTTTTTDNRNRDNTYTDNSNSGNTTTNISDSGNTETTTKNNGNTTDSGNTSDSGNTAALVVVL